MKFSLLAIITTAFLGGCQKQDAQPLRAAADPASAPAVSASLPNTPGLPASVAVSFSKSPAYELADALRWALPDAMADSSMTAGLQDYNRFKGIVQDIKVSPDHHSKYVGAVTLVVDGQRMQTENIVDNYRTAVRIIGPEAGAQGITFTTGVREALDVGPTYLRKHGLDVIPLSCFSVGKTPNNAEALYLVRAPGKAPTYVTYLVSTGSGGVFIDYTVRYGGMDWKDVPGATELQFDGTAQPFGFCPYKQMQ